MHLVKAHTYYIAVSGGGRIVGRVVTAVDGVLPCPIAV